MKVRYLAAASCLAVALAAAASTASGSIA
ncbi:MAG: hypothetical protein QOE95_1155, partial [Gaiellaceae bacterium]|nr:hypothetical protein [Gaiellaceae bacterium]